MDTFLLEKFVWDDEDFEKMGWHDATIWSVAANPKNYEFNLDIDYIFKWVSPDPGETNYKFWVSPVTMVFENVHTIRMEIASEQGDIQVADLSRGAATPTPNKKMYQRKYRFECQEGEISLVSTGYKMFVRKTPVLNGTSQRFTWSQRGGVSFAPSHPEI